MWWFILLDVEIVRLDSVTKRFNHRPGLAGWFSKERSGMTVALDRVSLTVEQAEILVLLGPNGSGKSTLLRLISTMLLPDEGTVTVHGQNTLKATEQVKQHVGIAVANDRSFFPRLTATENLDFFGTLENIAKEERAERISRVLELMGLAPAANTLTMKFSTGMYQRLGIARAMLKQPKILLLDEPSRSLDPAATNELWVLLGRTSAAGTTLLLATHDFEEARLATRICVLSHGQVKALERIKDCNVEEIRETYFSAVQEASA